MPIEAEIPDDFNPEQREEPTWGKYHCSVIRCDEEGGKRGEMIIDLEILAGDPPDQEGLVHRTYFSKTTKAMGRLHQFAMACGLITSDQLKSMKERGQTPSYDFEGEAVGKQLFIHLERDEYNGKERAKLGFGIYHPLSQKVKDWPKNKAMLAAAGFDVSQMNEGQASAPPANSSTSSKPTPPAKANDVDIDELFSGAF